MNIIQTIDAKIYKHLRFRKKRKKNEITAPYFVITQHEVYTVLLSAVLTCSSRAIKL